MKKTKFIRLATALVFAASAYGSILIASQAPAAAAASQDSCTSRLYGQGDAGKCVGYIQQMVKNSGADKKLKVDKQFGPQTDSAVRKYQAAHDLKLVDGLVGPETWGSLCATSKSSSAAWKAAGCKQLRGTPADKHNSSGVCVTRTLDRDDTGSCVRTMQKLINYHHTNGKQKTKVIATDGQFGPETHNAVSAFQTTHNLPRTGIMGNNTWRKLCTDSATKGRLLTSGDFGRAGCQTFSSTNDDSTGGRRATLL